MAEWERFVLIFAPAFVFSTILVVLIGEHPYESDAKAQIRQATIQSYAAVSGMFSVLAAYVYCPLFLQLEAYGAYGEVARWVFSIASTFVVTPVILLIARWTPLLWEQFRDGAGWNG